MSFVISRSAPVVQAENEALKRDIAHRVHAELVDRIATYVSDFGEDFLGVSDGIRETFQPSSAPSLVEFVMESDRGVVAHTKPSRPPRRW